MTYDPVGRIAANVDALPAIVVGPGCRRIDLPSRDGARFWIVDIDAGAEWPHIDRHGHQGEDIFVVAGELIEGEHRYGPGTFIHFAADSSHRPRSAQGVRLFGLNLTGQVEQQSK